MSYIRALAKVLPLPFSRIVQYKRVTDSTSFQEYRSSVKLTQLQHVLVGGRVLETNVTHPVLHPVKGYVKVWNSSTTHRSPDRDSTFLQQIVKVRTVPPPEAQG